MSGATQCRLCGAALDPVDDDTANDLCADCRWDDETDADGQINP